jgi:hypothetical protein
MISDLTGTRHDVIPGRLKAVVLDLQTTVAYAGLPDQGIDAIKRARELLSSGASISDVEQMLAATTEKYSDKQEFKLDFLIASHRDGATLKRIWNGGVSSRLEQTCIGQRDLFSALLKQEGDTPRSVVPHEFEEEGPFLSAFHNLFNGLYVSEGEAGLALR